MKALFLTIFTPLSQCIPFPSNVFFRSPFFSRFPFAHRLSRSLPSAARLPPKTPPPYGTPICSLDRTPLSTVIATDEYPIRDFLCLAFPFLFPQRECLFLSKSPPIRVETFPRGFPSSFSLLTGSRRSLPFPVRTPHGHISLRSGFIVQEPPPYPIPVKDIFPLLPFSPRRRAVFSISFHGSPFSR